MFDGSIFFSLRNEADTYLPKLVRAGKRVAICEQLEDTKQKETQEQEHKVVELVTPQNVEETPKVEPSKPDIRQVEPPTPEAKTEPKEIDTSGGPDYSDNPDPRLFASVSRISLVMTA